jgi:hypothetical protein
MVQVDLHLRICCKSFEVCRVIIFMLTTSTCKYYLPDIKDKEYALLNVSFYSVARIDDASDMPKTYIYLLKANKQKGWWDTMKDQRFMGICTHAIHANRKKGSWPYWRSIIGPRYQPLARITKLAKHQL